ncbi:MarR family transcriptional regulator [Streptomyces sp. 8N706]|uniref:MarR family transcriptional regulator n=1 Tax=Streptomyces sp. 8N706 TaxID=3457416 RepID=UPI003FCF7D27
MASPGYGKRSVPGQSPRRQSDFTHLPPREASIAAHVDRLPDGAAIDAKTLAKELPGYGRQAARSALNALSEAGHLRRVRETVGGGRTQWVYRTYFSRVARDDAWWAGFLAGDVVDGAPSAVPDARPLSGRTPPQRPGLPPDDQPATKASSPGPRPERPVRLARTTGPAPTVPTARHALAAHPAGPTRLDGPEPTAGRSAPRPTARPAPPGPEARPVQPAAARIGQSAPTTRTARPARTDRLPRSEAYEVLAGLGRADARMTLSAAECAKLEGAAAEWLARGATATQLVSALTAGLPAEVHCPGALARSRLTTKLPPERVRPPGGAVEPGGPDAPRRIMECTECGAPGRPEALPGGLCRTCRGRAPGPCRSRLSAAEIHARVESLKAAARTPEGSSV